MVFIDYSSQASFNRLFSERLGLAVRYASTESCSRGHESGYPRSLPGARVRSAVCGPELGTVLLSATLCCGLLLVTTVFRYAEYPTGSHFRGSLPRILNSSGLTGYQFIVLARGNDTRGGKKNRVAKMTFVVVLERKVSSRDDLNRVR